MRSRSKDFYKITFSYLNKNSKTLKGKCFWKVKIPQQSTWGCRNLLKLGNIEDKQFSQFEVGDGKYIFLGLDWCPTRRTPVSEQCLFFFASLTRLRRLRHTTSEKKKKSQILTNGLTNTVDFVIYPTTTSLRSHQTETHISSSHFSTHPPSL